MKFADLKDGDAFIFPPDENEDGGLYVFVKEFIWCAGVPHDQKPNAYKRCNGVGSHMPDSMPVVKVLL